MERENRREEDMPSLVKDSFETLPMDVETSSESELEVVNLQGSAGNAEEQTERLEMDLETKPGSELEVVGMQEKARDEGGQTKFRPGSIHEGQFRSFWKDVLMASPWVMKFLDEGYRIPFETIPGKYEEENNASALKNMKIVREIVKDMVDSNIVKIVQEKPTCVSPLGLVSKAQPGGKMKHRLVFDASRWVNEHIKDQKVTLSHLEKALEMTEKNDWQVVFDLKSAYYHIRMADEHHEFLGAAIVNEDRSKTYFVYQHLPFGLKCAVHIITKVWKPLIAYFQSTGIRSSIYIDDGRLLATSAAEAESFRRRAYDIIERAGWIIEKSKSDSMGSASREKTYLGFLIDTETMTVMKDKEKLKEILKTVKKVWCDKTVQVKDLASALGKMVALTPSHGNLARFCTRSGYVDITEHVDKSGWKGTVRLSEGCLEELKFFMANADKENGFPIRSQLTAIRIDSILTNAKSSREVIGANRGGEACRIVSDASSFKAAVMCLDSKEERILDFPFTESEKATSSGLRELLAVQRALHLFIFEGAIKSRLIYWFTDSTNVVSFLEKGSSKRHVQKIVLDIAVSLAKLGSWIQPIHLYRDDERVAGVDLVSKEVDSDDWSLDVTSFNKLNQRFDFKIDMFASVANKRLDKFVTKIFERGCSGVDAFAQLWIHGMWMCPPVSLLPRIANELRYRKNCGGILIIPDWPTATFYGKFFRNGETRYPFTLAEKINPYIYQNQGAVGALCGKITFQLCVLQFET